MARVLLDGESRFLSSCDFKGLRVIKRPRFTTLTLAASQYSLNSTARCARDAACRRAPEIVVDRIDARPAQRRQTIAHRILQGAALAIVENLMGGGLPDIQDRLAPQMVRP